MKKKGLSISDIPQIAIIILISGSLLGATYLGLQGFQDSTTTDSRAYNGTEQILNMTDNFVTQLETAGTMLGIAVMVSAVLAIAVVGNRRGLF